MDPRSTSSRFIKFFGLVALCMVAAGCSQQTTSSPFPGVQLARARPEPAKPGYELLYSFEGGAKGSSPAGALLWRGSTQFIGTTSAGGDSHNSLGCGCGTAFSFETDPVREVPFYSFGSGQALTDGVYPTDGLTVLHDSLYATTRQGGSASLGAVVEVFLSGPDRVLYGFKGGSDGAFPQAGLTAVNDGLFGTTSGGGTHDLGTVFTVLRSGDEEVLYSFAGKPDGATPDGRLITVHHNSDVLYGTTQAGGEGDCPSQCGTVYKLARSGSESVLYRFKDSPDGAGPVGSLTELNGKLYGVTAAGGNSSRGTVYELTLSGNERVLYRFGGPYSDGAAPLAGLVAFKNVLYGTTEAGGARDLGTLFELNPATGVEQILHSFTGPPDGASPAGNLIVVSKGAGADELYGTTLMGGKDGAGSIFEYRLP